MKVDVETRWLVAAFPPVEIAVVETRLLDASDSMVMQRASGCSSGVEMSYQHSIQQSHTVEIRGHWEWHIRQFLQICFCRRWIFSWDPPGACSIPSMEQNSHLDYDISGWCKRPDGSGHFAF